MAEYTILVGSNDPMRRRFLETVLERAGHHAIGASSALEATSATANGAERLHLIVLDRTFGEDAAAPLRAMYPGVPVLVVEHENSAELLTVVGQRLARPPAENA